MDLFIQVKKAYDILNDPQKRAIYDVVGMKGLKAEGWEVNQRYTFILNDIFCVCVFLFLLIDCQSNKNCSRNSRRI
jgi:DnaJ-class molecular chaperone